jgi:hypothetical protein
MKVQIKGTQYVNRAGEVCSPYSVVELRTDEAYELVRCGIADAVDAPVVENTMAAQPVEIRKDEKPKKGKKADAESVEGN